MKYLIIKMKNTGHVMAKLKQGQYESAKLLIAHYEAQDRAWGCHVEYVVDKIDEENI